MVAHASVNCHIVPTPKPGFAAATPGSWPQIRVRLQRLDGDKSLTINVLDHTRMIVGKLNSKVAHGLVPLLNSHGLSIRTDALIGPRPRQPDEVPGKPISRSYNLQLMLYGKQRHAKTIGSHLSKPEVSLNLLKPFRLEKGVRLLNPLAKENRPAPGPRTYEAPPPPAVMRTPEQIRADVFRVFDSLTDSDALPESEPDARILTPLLKHQKQALYFMKDREDPTRTVDELWRRDVDARGQIAYYNIITNQRVHSPPTKSQGGILADMMGLGKTLSILSLVTSTSQEALEWANQAPEPPGDSAGPQRQGGVFNMPQAGALGLTKVRQNAKTTLLVCPLSTTTNWEDQIKQHIQPLGLTYYLYHGQNRTKDWEKLVEFDLVITTYNIASNELGARARKAGKQPLEEIGWFRIVLDEAHAIREPSTLTFKAICRLHASRRWAVTGTPVQNKLDDLGSLLAFLRIKPFHDRAVFKQHIIMPFKICDEQIIPKIRLLVDSITIRRMKDKIDIPKRHDEVIKLQFSDDERWLYEAFQKDALLRVNVLKGHGDRLVGQNKYVHILKSILRLRMFCSGGKDLMKESDLRMLEGMRSDMPIDIDSDDDDDAANNPALTESKAYDIYNLMHDTGVDICENCDRKLDEDGDNDSESQEGGLIGHITSCYHLICTSCMPKFQGVCSCGMAGVSVLPLRSDRAVEEHDANLGAKAKGSKAMDLGDMTAYNGPNTKLRYLLNELLKWKEKSMQTPEEPPYKSVVFSEWTTNLNLIQRALQDEGITFVRLDGSMNLPARARALDSFRDDPEIQVILVSTKAGSLGLNLTAGNSVYIIEPLYNPAAEAQAIDRVHRLGQKREVHCVRLLMDNSIELKMRELQDKKMKLASLSMDRHAAGSLMSKNKSQAGKARLEEILSLFGKGSKL